jgi:hypothetical protein
MCKRQQRKFQNGGPLLYLFIAAVLVKPFYQFAGGAYNRWVTPELHNIYFLMIVKTSSWHWMHKIQNGGTLLYLFIAAAYFGKTILPVAGWTYKR